MIEFAPKKETCGKCGGDHQTLDCPRSKFGVKEGGCQVCGKNPCKCDDLN